MRPLDAEFGPQRLEILDEIVERVGRLRRGRFAMAAQIIADAAEFALEAFDESVPGMARRADAVDQEQWRAIAFDREGGSDRRRAIAYLSGYLSAINSPAMPQFSFSTSSMTTKTLSA